MEHGIEGRTEAQAFDLVDFDTGEVVSSTDDNRALPAIIEDAKRHLDEARTSAEVIQAMKMAEAALHFARIVKAANETQGDCLKLVVSAKIKIARAVDEGQRKGEIAKRNQPVSQYVHDKDIPPPATLDEVGIDRRRLHEWREMAEVGEDAIEEAIDEAVDEGRAPTQADVKKALNGAVQIVTGYTGNNEYYTPAEWIDRARDVMGGIDLDPASNAMAQGIVNATIYYTEETDGLAHEWSGKVWMNPPYAKGLIGQFIQKLSDAYDSGDVTEAIVLVDNKTDTRWFSRIWESCSAVAFTVGRIGFYNKDTESSSPTNGSAFFYLGKKPKAFAFAFSDGCNVAFPARTIPNG